MGSGVRLSEGANQWGNGLNKDVSIENGWTEDRTGIYRESGGFSLV